MNAETNGKCTGLARQFNWCDELGILLCVPTGAEVTVFLRGVRRYMAARYMRRDLCFVPTGPSAEPIQLGWNGSMGGAA